MKRVRDPLNNRRPLLGIVHDAREPATPSRNSTIVLTNAAVTITPLSPNPRTNPVVEALRAFSTSKTYMHIPTLSLESYAAPAAMMTQAEIDEGWHIALAEWDHSEEPVQ